MGGRQSVASWKQRVAGLIPRQLLVRRLSDEDSGVLLTFDDGPHPDVTPQVIARLDEFGARGMFFVIGQRIDQAVNAVRAVCGRGHRLGNHTFFHHDDDVWPGKTASTFAEYFRDIARCQQEIAKFADDAPKWFRPPGGRLNCTSLLAPRLQGLRTMTWSREIGDWGFRSIEEARRGGRDLARIVEPGDIVLLHDDNPRVLDVLDELLPALKKRNLNLWDAIDAL